MKAENTKMHQTPQLYNHDSISSSLVTSWCRIWLVRMVLGEVLHQPLIQYFAPWNPWLLLRIVSLPVNQQMEALSMLSDIQYTSLEWRGWQGGEERARTEQQHLMLWPGSVERHGRQDEPGDLERSGAVRGQFPSGHLKGKVFWEKLRPFGPADRVCWRSVGVGLPPALPW